MHNEMEKTNENLEEGDKNIFDPKVVSTVRYLQQNPSREGEKSNEEVIKSQKDKSVPFQGRRDRKYSLKNTVKITNNMRITIDGENTKDQIPSGAKHKHLSVKELTRVSFAPKSMFKTKSDFYKNLLSDGNILKYKTTCVSLIKDDEEMKQSILKLSTSFESFLEKYLFNDKIFLYKLESMLRVETSKNKKELFFKNEIKKYTHTLTLDMDYQKVYASLQNSIDLHIDKINNYHFLQ